MSAVARARFVDAYRPGLLVTLTALAAGWIAFSVLVWAYGASPAAAAAELFGGTWGSMYGIGQVIFKMTPLLFTGMAVDIALRAGLFNIGAEGQLAVASLAAASVGAALPSGASAAYAVPLVIAVAFAAGALWAAVPALLRAGFGAHEVISTFMMNRIADAVVGLALGAGLAQAGTVRTRDMVQGARLPRLDAIPGLGAFGGSAASVACVAAIVLVVVVMAWLRRTAPGRETILIGQNADACAANGVPVRRRIAIALLASGGIAGLASTGTVLGYKGYFESGLGAGAGFGGIAVALLARGNVIGMVLAALLFGTLQQGGFAINSRVPMAVMDVFQAVVIATVALADTQVRRAILRAVRAPIARVAREEKP